MQLLLQTFKCAQSSFLLESRKVALAFRNILLFATMFPLLLICSSDGRWREQIVSVRTHFYIFRQTINSLCTAIWCAQSDLSTVPAGRYLRFNLSLKSGLWIYTGITEGCGREDKNVINWYSSESCNERERERKLVINKHGSICKSQTKSRRGDAALWSVILSLKLHVSCCLSMEAMNAG